MTGIYTTKLYKDMDGWTVAAGPDDEILDESNTDIETVFQTALDRKGDLWLCPSQYLLSNGLTGLNLKPATTIFSGYGVDIRVPQGYVGGLWCADLAAAVGSLYDVKFVGSMYTNEQGTPERNWNSLHLKLNNGDNGVTHCDFGGIKSRNTKSGICIEIIDDLSWCTSSMFHDFTTYETVNCFELLNTVADPDPGISSLKLRDITMQANTMTEYGIKGIDGNNWVFDNCAMWDMHASTVPDGTGLNGENAVSSQFLPNATNMLVLGGIMMHWNVDNQAKKGQVRWIDGHGGTPNLDQYGELFQTAGNGISKTITIPHGMGLTPRDVFVQAVSRDAVGEWYITKDATNIYVNYTSKAPPVSTASNPNNIQLFWRASVK